MASHGFGTRQSKICCNENKGKEGAISRKSGHGKHTKDYWVTHIASSNLHRMSRLKTKQ